MCGIVAIVSRPTTRPTPAAGDLLAALDRAVAAEGLLPAAALVAEVDRLLHGVPGVLALAGRAELIAGVTARLDQLDARTINDSGDPLWGRLVEVSLPDSGRERFLDAICGTGRRFALPVPPDTASVDQAQSVLHGGLPPEILRFSVERT